VGLCRVTTASDEDLNTDGLGLWHGHSGVDPRLVGFVGSWIPVLGIVWGLVLGIASVVFGAIAVANARSCAAGAVSLCLGLVTILLKLVPGINLL